MHTPVTHRWYASDRQATDKQVPCMTLDNKWHAHTTGTRTLGTWLAPSSMPECDIFKYACKCDTFKYAYKCDTHVKSAVIDACYTTQCWMRHNALYLCPTHHTAYLCHTHHTHNAAYLCRTHHTHHRPMIDNTGHNTGHTHIHRWLDVSMTCVCDTYGTLHGSLDAYGTLHGSLDACITCLHRALERTATHCNTLQRTDACITCLHQGLDVCVSHWYAYGTKCHTWYLSHRLCVCVWHALYTCGTWLINLCDMCVIWLVCVCGMSYVCVWHELYTCGTWLLHVCDVTYDMRDMCVTCAWHELYVCVTWLMCVCDMTHVFAWHHYVCLWHDSKTCDMTCVCVLMKCLCEWKTHTDVNTMCVCLNGLWLCGTSLVYLCVAYVCVTWLKYL